MGKKISSRGQSAEQRRRTDRALRRQTAAKPDASPEEIMASLEREGVRTSPEAILHVKWEQQAAPAPEPAGPGGKAAEPAAEPAAPSIAPSAAEPAAPSGAPSAAKPGRPSKKKRRPKKRVVKPPSQPRRTAIHSGMLDKVDIDDLIAAKELAEKLGGVERAREALEALDRLSGSP